MSLKNNPWVYAGLITCLNLICIYSQYQLTPISQDIIAAYVLNKHLFSTIFTAPMVPAIFLSIPAGILIDRFGVRPVVLTAMTTSLIGLWLRPFVSGYGGLYGAMLVSGVAVAVVNATIAKILEQRFPVEHVGRLVGLVMAGGSLGMVVAAATTAHLPSIRMAFLIPAVVLSVVAVFFFLFLYVPKETSEDVSHVDDHEPIRLAVGKVLRSRNIWLTGLSAGLVMSLNVALSSYVPMALQEVRGMSSQAAGLVASVMLFGVLLGSALGPQLLRFFPGLRSFCLIVGITTGIGGAFGWLMPAGILLLVALFITGFGLGGLMPVFLSLPVVFKEVGPRYAGTGGGLIATMQLLGAVLLPSFVFLPIAQESFQLFFVFAGLGVVLMSVITQFIKV